jgi:polar amino acid transport system substrate-binding protein
LWSIQQQSCKTCDQKADIGTGDWYRTVAGAKVLGLSYPLYIDQMGIYSKTGIKTVTIWWARKSAAWPAFSGLTTCKVAGKT